MTKDLEENEWHSADSMFINTLATKVSLSLKEEFFDIVDLKNGSRMMRKVFKECEDPNELLIPRATAYL